MVQPLLQHMLLYCAAVSEGAAQGAGGGGGMCAGPAGVSSPRAALHAVSAHQSLKLGLVGRRNWRSFRINYACSQPYKRGLG